MSVAPDPPTRVRQTIARHAMLSEDASVLVAVSGGVDSMVLLHVLHALGYSVTAATFDHDTRAGGSTEDAAFVRAHCEQIGVPCVLGHWRDWPAQLVGTASFEMEARARRYAFLLGTARELQCSAIATGHHADDQAETVLMRVLRGTGPGGLAGIPPVRIEDGVRIVRPLLDCPRTDIEDWANARGIPWREDWSNGDVGVPRNRLRRHLLPQLAEEYNPNVQAALTRLADSARTEDDLLASLAAGLLECAVQEERLSREAFRAAHPALQRRAIMGWLRKHGVRPDHDLMVDLQEFVLHANTGQRISLDANYLLHAADGEILLVRETQPLPTPVTLPVPGECTFLCHRFVASAMQDAPKVSPRAWCSPTRQIFDADRLGDALLLRTRRDGDAFTPLGLNGKRKLQDYFIDRHVPRPDRDRVPLLEAAGEIAWVVGHAPSAHVAVNELTKNFVSVEALPCD